MFTIQISIEPEVFLPLDYSEGGIERVEVGNLNIRSVLVIRAWL